MRAGPQSSCFLHPAAVSWRKTVQQEVQALPECAVPIIVEKQTRALDCRVVLGETGQALLSRGPVFDRESKLARVTVAPIT
ncbi:hypothetical protein FHX15_001663 [Rhizobium sp. BK650]|nr:hypothetical protein [Rhizobium sp. BK650]